MRNLSNWLEGYIQYTEETESSPIFNKWVGISTISSVLRKKVWLDFGRFKIYPNTYIVLVAPPGVARKTQAITYASELLNQIPGIFISADSTTAQALLDDIEQSVSYSDIPGHSVLRHCSLSVISKEFESFLNSAATSSKMLVTLTDLFDAGELTWKHKTRNAGVVILPAVYLNILGATTPQALDSCLSLLAIGGGLTSRILFVYADTKTKKIAIPELNPSLQKLQENLITDLLSISLMTGPFKLSDDAIKMWTEWYNNYDETSKKRLQPRMEFDGWYSRKPLHIQKVSICLSACTSETGIVYAKDIEAAIYLVEEVEKVMGNIFYGTAFEVDANPIETLLMKYITQYKDIAETHLLQLIWRDVDEEKFDLCIKRLITKGFCSVYFKGSEGKEEIWYKLLQ